MHEGFSVGAPGDRQNVDCTAQYSIGIAKVASGAAAVNERWDMGFSPVMEQKNAG